MKRRGVTKKQLSITIGTPIEYTKDDGSHFLAIASSEPQKLGGHTWVIWLAGISGCVALERCKPITFQALATHP